jgi:hypothetical protein
MTSFVALVTARLFSSAVKRTALATLVAAAGCHDPPLAPSCGGEIGQAVSVYLRDARTSAPLPAANARGAVQAGAFVDSLHIAVYAPQSSVLVGGGDRVGTYTVTVEMAGYAPWRRDGVVARREMCGIVTQYLAADLEPAP